MVGFEVCKEEKGLMPMLKGLPSYQEWMDNMTKDLRRLALEDIDPKKGTVIKRDCGCIWQLDWATPATIRVHWTCTERSKNLTLYGDTRGRLEP